MSRELFLNVDFDLSLRPRWQGSSRGSERRRIREMAAHVLFALPARDSLLVDEAPPTSFLEHLRACGLGVPAISVRPAIRASARFVPYGWNEQAVELNRRYQFASEHPQLVVVKRVNGRSFGAAVAREVDGDGFDLGSASSVDEAANLVAGVPSSSLGWVLKTEHGNAALGNRRLRHRQLSPRDRQWIAARLADDDTLRLEPWCERSMDLCATFEVDRAGAVHGFFVHELINTAAGAFIGAVFDRASPAVAPWRHQLGRAASVVARRLAEAGYFGPVCMDAYVWRSPEGPRLRAVVDLNARRHVSACALEWWQGLPEGTVGFWRFFVRRRFPRLPDDHGAFRTALGDEVYRPERARGVLLCSPLTVGVGKACRPAHAFSVFFVASSRHEANAMCRDFRQSWER